jgi:hypothetical protein
LEALLGCRPIPKDADQGTEEPLVAVAIEAVEVVPRAGSVACRIHALETYPRDQARDGSVDVSWPTRNRAKL